MRPECCTRAARGRFCNEIAGTMLQNIHRIEPFRNMLQILGTPGYTCNRLRLLSQNCFEGGELPVQEENRMCSHGFRHELRTFQPNTFQDMFLDTSESRVEEPREERTFELSNYGLLRQYVISMKKSYLSANGLRVYELFKHACSFRDAYQFKLLSSVSYEAIPVFVRE